MYQIKTDCHVHTILSGHAYSTVEECAIYAAKQELEGIVITDHFCPIREEEFGDKIVPIIQPDRTAALYSGGAGHAGNGSGYSGFGGASGKL